MNKLENIRIEVESNDTWQTKKGNVAQKIFIHGISKYPKEITRVMDREDIPLTTGLYIPNTLVLDWGKLTVDYNNLKRVESNAK